MRTHLRVVEEKEVISSYTNGASRLSSVLSEIQNVSALSAISLHPRGGYSVSIEIAETAVDALAAKLEANGFRFVI